MSALAGIDIALWDLKGESDTVTPGMAYAMSQRRGKRRRKLTTAQSEEIRRAHL